MHFPPYLILAGLLVLTACGGPAATTAHYLPTTTPGARLCTDQCGEARDYCVKTCDLAQRRCTNAMQAQAIMDYDKYARDQLLAHQPVEFLARDFERPERCSPTDCRDDCETHYRSCYQNCGGKVDVTTSCQFLCF